MFNVNYKGNLCVCFWFLLVKRIIQVKVAAYPIQNTSSCNCVLLQSCNTFNSLIDNSSDEKHIKAAIQNAVCFYDGFSILVCCPDKFEHKGNIKGKPKLDYLDELTGLNCPPSFGREYKYDDYIKTHDGEAKYYHHAKDSKIDYGGVHDDTTDCEDFGNCGTFNHRPYHQHDHHAHHHYHAHVPFFPQPDKNRNFHGNSMEESTPRPGNKESNSCGILPPVLGNTVQVYPWITRLAYLNTTSRTIRYRCMGTIISDQHILTAAHCVDQLVTDLRLFYVRVGDDADFEDYNILETIVHSKYNEPLFNNDVAILKIALKAQKKGALMKICLPKNDSSTLSGDTGVVAGWSNSGISEVRGSTIRYINLPIMNNTECAIRYAKYSENFETSIVITPTEFCAKAVTMNDVCEGDSGGPFMERSKSGRYTLLGIVAFGPKTNCGQSTLPGVYMRVSSYTDWIRRNIQ